LSRLPKEAIFRVYCLPRLAFAPCAKLPHPSKRSMGRLNVLLTGNGQVTDNLTRALGIMFGVDSSDEISSPNPGKG
jgi:hypothetical protein